MICCRDWLKIRLSMNFVTGLEFVLDFRFRSTLVDHFTPATKAREWISSVRELGSLGAWEFLERRPKNYPQNTHEGFAQPRKMCAESRQEHRLYPPSNPVATSCFGTNLDVVDIGSYLWLRRRRPQKTQHQPLASQRRLSHAKPVYWD